MDECPVTCNAVIHAVKTLLTPTQFSVFGRNPKASYLHHCSPHMHTHPQTHPCVLTLRTWLPKGSCANGPFWCCIWWYIALIKVKYGMAEWTVNLLCPANFTLIWLTALMTMKIWNLLFSFIYYNSNKCPKWFAKGLHRRLITCEWIFPFFTFIVFWPMRVSPQVASQFVHLLLHSCPMCPNYRFITSHAANDRQTDTQTKLHMIYVAVGYMYAMHGMMPNNNNNNNNQCQFLCCFHLGITIAVVHLIYVMNAKPNHTIDNKISLSSHCSKVKQLYITVVINSSI